jgi:hypothetical protein
VTASKPNYDEKAFSNEVYSSIEKFRMMWDMRFSGSATRKYESDFDSFGAKKEHWKRIQALNRRIAEFGTIEYDYLSPVSELKGFVSEQISCYLDNSHKCSTSPTGSRNHLASFRFQNTFRLNV